jgi:hypothetical protein
MKLTAAELAYVRSQGLYITAKCHGCGKLLNQTFRYTIMNKPEVHCSAQCRDFAFFGGEREARKHVDSGKCGYCGASLQGKRRGTRYCDHLCQMRAHRTSKGATTGKPQITVTPAQLNQQLAEAKTGGQGNPYCQRLPTRDFGSKREIGGTSGSLAELWRVRLWLRDN